MRAQDAMASLNEALSGATKAQAAGLAGVATGALLLWCWRSGTASTPTSAKTIDHGHSDSVDASVLKLAESAVMAAYGQGFEKAKALSHAKSEAAVAMVEARATKAEARAAKAEAEVERSRIMLERLSKHAAGATERVCYPN